MAAPPLSPDAPAGAPRDDDIDLLIVGAGPAGLSAAVTAQALKLRAVVVEGGDRPGGQLLRNPTPIADCPGIESPTGMALAARLIDHLERLGGHVTIASEALRVDVVSGEVELSGERLRARFILLASGARRRTLGVAGEGDALGRGIWPAARRFGSLYRGRSVLVVGGGDVALEEAMLFAHDCERVILAHRGSRFRGRPDFQAAVLAEPRIDVRMETSLAAIEGDPDVEGALLDGPGGRSRVAVAGVFICAGLAPNSELVRGQVETDAQGFVVTDVRQRTSARRLYAAGDVCALSAWSAAAAIGQAAIAVKDMERRICAGDLP